MKETYARGKKDATQSDKTTQMSEDALQMIKAFDKWEKDKRLRDHIGMVFRQAMQHEYSLLIQHIPNSQLLLNREGMKKQLKKESKFSNQFLSLDKSKL